MNKKIKSFVIGRTTLRQRFWESFLSALALSSILFFFGPLDIASRAANFVSFSVRDIFLECCLWWFVVFAVLFLCAWISGGLVHSWLVSIYTGSTLAFYIQAHWMNPDLGILDGSSIDWTKYAASGIPNLGLFLLLLLIPLIVRFFSGTVWKGLVLILCADLIVMQSVSMGASFIPKYKDQKTSEKRFYVSKEDEFVMGSEENIIVFVLDYVGHHEMKLVLNTYPNLLEPFHDFFYFDNLLTQNVGTFPSTTYLLTGQTYDFENETPDEYFTRAWHNTDTEAFYEQMLTAGWDVNIYNSINHCAGKAENAYGKLSNVISTDRPEIFAIRRSTFKKLICLSFYRYFPLLMKAPYWINTDELSDMKILSPEETPWDPIESINKFWANGITVGASKKVYRSYHFAGAHEPYKLNQWGRMNENFSDTDLVQQLAGHFRLISEYIMYLKDLELYDSSTLIITTDHGHINDPSAIFYIKPAHYTSWKMVNNHAPIIQGNYMETIAQAAGLPAGQFGRSVFDVQEDEIIERCTYIRGYDESFPAPAPGKHFNILTEVCSEGDLTEIKTILNNQGGRKIFYPNSFY